MKIEIKIHARDECFTHKDDSGKFRTFITGAMSRFAHAYAPMLPEHIQMGHLAIKDFPLDHLRENMGIEQDRVDRLREPYLSVPIIGIYWPDLNFTGGNFTCVDGNHRILKLASLGRTRVNAYIFKHPFWEQFLAPISRGEEALTGNSGMLAHDRRKA